MRSTQTKLLYVLTLIAVLLTCAACATSSPPQPPVVVQPIQLTPLPASVKEIDLKASEDWRARASRWLQKLDDFLISETSK